jgi:protein-S-isoprenylcysteine O-methyltransferase Ste14
MVNEAWIIVTLLPAIAVMSFVVIPREERYLEARFGEEYKTYKASVRRWL